MRITVAGCLGVVVVAAGSPASHGADDTYPKLLKSRETGDARYDVYVESQTPITRQLNSIPCGAPGRFNVEVSMERRFEFFEREADLREISAELGVGGEYAGLSGRLGIRDALLTTEGRSRRVTSSITQWLSDSRQSMQCFEVVPSLEYTEVEYRVERTEAGLLGFIEKSSDFGWREAKDARIAYEYRFRASCAQQCELRRTRDELVEDPRIWQPVRDERGQVTAVIEIGNDERFVIPLAFDENLEIVGVVERLPERKLCELRNEVRHRRGMPLTSCE